MGGIARLFGENGENVVKAALNVMIGDIIKFVNVGKTMTGTQLTETVGLLLKHYHHLKPEDFKLCLEEVKKGTYGQLYDRLDGQVILSWFKQYDAQRDYLAAEINSNQCEEFKMADKRLLLPEKQVDDEVFITNMAKLKATLADNKIAREKAKNEVKADRPKDAAYEMSQRWLSQFDKLYMLQPVGKLGRFVKRYGRIININEFLEHKHWQYMLCKIDKEQRMKFYLLKYPKK